MFDKIKKYFSNFSYSFYENYYKGNWRRNNLELYRTTDVIDSCYMWLADYSSNFQFVYLPEKYNWINFKSNELQTQKEFYLQVMMKALQSGRCVFDFENGVILYNYEIVEENGKTYYATDYGLYGVDEVIDFVIPNYKLSNISEQIFEALKSLDGEMTNPKRAKYITKLETEMRHDALAKLKQEMLLADNNGMVVIDKKISDFKELTQIDAKEQEFLRRLEQKVFRIFKINNEIITNSSSKEEIERVREVTIEPILKNLEQQFKMKIDPNIEILHDYLTRMTPEKLDSASKYGYIYINEARKYTGLTAVDDGDKLIENWNESKKGTNE